MAKTRSPSRDRAFKLWRKSGGSLPLKELAEQLGVSPGLVRKWKNIDKWADRLNGSVTKDGNAGNGNVTIGGGVTDREPDGRFAPGNKASEGFGAPKGNKNALGNKGGAPPRNTNAVKTGEYRTVWMDYLSEEEQAFYDSVDTSADSQIDHAIRILAMKERWCMQAIRDLRSGLSEKCKKVLAERKDKGEILKVYDESGKATMVYRDSPEMVVTEITETEFRKIDDILRQEETLIKIQNTKAKQLALKHRIDIDYERLALEREKARIAAANVLRLNLPAESDVAGMNEKSKVVFYLPDNGRDDHG